MFCMHVGRYALNPQTLQRSDFNQRMEIAQNEQFLSAHKTLNECRKW